MTELNDEIHELNIDELETISGGRGNHGDFAPVGGNYNAPLSDALRAWDICMTIARGQ